MSTVLASAEDHRQVRSLLEGSRYRYCDFGLEDLPQVLERNLVILAESHGDVWGCLGIQLKVRSQALPPDAPYFCPLRCVALSRGRHPTSGLSELLARLQPFLCTQPDSLRLTAYGSETWLKRALISAGFEIVERLEFFRRSDRTEVAKPTRIDSDVRLRPAQAVDLEALARLDAATFDPLWHYGADELAQLHAHGRMQVAEQAGALLGYSALTLNLMEAQLVRLAVHPDVQGRGIGRRLLTDALAFANQAGIESIALNTQASNGRSKKLYRAFGFHVVGQLVPVLVGKLPSTTA